MSLLWCIIEKLVFFFLNMIFKLIHKELTDEIFKAFMQFVRFGLVGVSNVVISYLVYAAALFVIQDTGLIVSFDYLVAQVISFLLSVLWSFYWNHKFVFNQGDNFMRNWFVSLLKAYASYAFTGLVLNGLLSMLLIELLHMNKFIAPVINLFICIPLNFILNKYWTFRGMK